MESFRARRGGSTDGSGGKIMRGRRRLPVRSPYARPTTPQRRSRDKEEDEENPNWLVGLVSPAAKVITGAGKFISNVFFPDSTTSSSSTSAGYNCRCNAEDDESNDDISSEDVDKSDENTATPEAFKHSQNNLQLRVQKSKAKLVIEKLLKEEFFSRDECNRLVEIIQSRTVEFPATKEGEDSYTGNGFDTFSPRVASLGGHTSDFRNTAIMEAKKWLEENKLECERTFNSSLPNVAEGELGSPVIVAKSYMKARPLWASPTIGHTGYQISSPVGMHLFKDTPSSFGANFLSSSKAAKRSNLTFDSSGILDGTRRVRFKSAGDVLQPFSSSSLELDYGGDKTSFEAEKGGVELGSVARNSNSSPLLGSVSAATPFATLAALEDARVTTGEGCSTHERRYSSLEQHNGPLNQPADIVAELKVMPSEDIKHAFESDMNGLTGVSDAPEFGKRPEVHIKNSTQEHQCSDLKETNLSNGARSFQEDLTTQKEVNRSREAVAANGFPTSSRLSAGSRHTPENEGDPKPISSNDGKMTTGITLEESCEASVEVPINDDVDSIASGSENNSSKHSEELFHSNPELDLSPKPKFSTRIEKQVAKKVGRYSRRGRGRGY